MKRLDNFTLRTLPHLQAQNWQDHLQAFRDVQAVRPLVVLIGPTASGKTALSIEMALRLREGGAAVEIVNADSRQLYKHLDIGTAKITEEEMNGVPHHLLSVLDPKESVTIAWYQKEAMRVIGELHARNILPILVGGSMLYISSIIDGLEPQVSDPLLRAELEEEYDSDAGKRLYARLRERDPASAASIPVQNKKYVVRAMEMIEKTGKTKKETLQGGACPYATLILGLDLPDAVLKKRIEDRVHQMFDAGWTEEVKRLQKLGFSSKHPAMQSHGYREILAALESGVDPRSTASEICKKSWQYVRRHRTWWRDDMRVICIP